MRKLLCAALLIYGAGTMSHAQTGNSVPAQTVRTQTNPPSISPVLIPDEFIIGPQDVLDISVWGEPDFDTTVAVRPDGKIGIRLLTDIQAAGLTAMQLKDKITQGLRPYVPEPVVTVIVKQINSQVVHIMGRGIQRTGPYPITGPMTVMELIAKAGGFTESARSREVMIFRKAGSVDNRFMFNYETYLKGQSAQNIPLKNGDLVVVE